MFIDYNGFSELAQHFDKQMSSVSTTQTFFGTSPIIHTSLAYLSMTR
jgi:hypothetical protein